MNNKVSAESKEAAIKTLAIVGFIAAIVVALWLAVQIVRFVPSAWTSLASIAESVYGTDESLAIATEKNIVNSGEAFGITWTKLRTEGAYVFSYRCADGVSAEVRTAAGDIVVLNCEEKLPFSGSAAQRIEIIFSSEKKRFTDVPFSISFIPEGNEQSAQEKNDLITVVNASIAQSDSVGIDDSEVIEPTDTSGNGQGQPTAPTTPSFPASNPQGYTDLQITYLGIGAFNKDTGIFTPGTVINSSTRSAVRFEVKNIGTKTSGTWMFDAEILSNPGYDYTSSAQAILRPNERAVITLGFDGVTNSAGTDRINVAVRESTDTNPANNSFSWSVTVVE